jgi:1-acyl-sn-glycerol-3-phosphate acyltransferase
MVKWCAAELPLFLFLELGENVSQQRKLARMKQQVYQDPRPAAYFDRFHQRARSQQPDWVYDLCRLIFVPLTRLLYRVEGIDRQNIPSKGPVILAPNHFSLADHFLVGQFTRRYVRFMAKSQLFKWPWQWIFEHGGVIPVRRGMRDDAAFETAGVILGRGGLVLIYPQAGRSRGGSLDDRPKPGVGRLTLENGVPVIPVAIYGSQYARNWKRLHFPKVVVKYGQPLHFSRRFEDSTREQQQVVADAIMDAIQRLYHEVEVELQNRRSASLIRRLFLT